MPELPEIAVFARDMRKELAGRTIVRIEVVQPKCLNLPVDGFQAALTGARVLGVTAHGKWLKVRTDRGWLLLNLGMGGEILLTDREHLPPKYRLLFDLDRGATLAVNFWWFGYAHYASLRTDPKGFPEPLGSVEIAHPMVSKLGPHALDLSLDQFRALLAGRRGAIKAFLLDQARIAGIGNVYIQDPLFKARLHPLRPVQTLSDEEVAALWQALRETLQESVDAGGAPFELNLYGQKGGWPAQFLVGYREGQPCPVCGTRVVKIRTGSTHSYICPRCQALPEHKVQPPRPQRTPRKPTVGQ